MLLYLCGSAIKHSNAYSAVSYPHAAQHASDFYAARSADAFCRAVRVDASSDAKTVPLHEQQPVASQSADAGQQQDGRGTRSEGGHAGKRGCYS